MDEFALSRQRCAFLTMDSTEGWSIDADLAIPPLEARHWDVDWVPWRSPGVDWDGYDAVYIATPWDYPDDPARFLGVLEQIDNSSAVLVNDLALVRWNIPKSYLRDLESRGAHIVPSRWSEHLEAGDLAALFDALSVERLIVKPVVSTNARDTYLLTRDSARAGEARLIRTFNERAFVVQPFIANVQSEGEYSLFYFGGEFSHAILKTPKVPDFRVQEEHGAAIVSVKPAAEILDCADRILELVEPTPVYARCDLVRGPDGRFLLMELELIEPSMYLRMDRDAPERFAAAFDRYVNGA